MQSVLPLHSPLKPREHAQWLTASPPILLTSAEGGAEGLTSQIRHLERLVSFLTEGREKDLARILAMELQSAQLWEQNAKLWEAKAHLEQQNARLWARLDEQVERIGNRKRHLEECNPGPAARIDCFERLVSEQASAGIAQLRPPA